MSKPSEFEDNDGNPWPRSENNYIEMKMMAGVPPEKAYLCFKKGVGLYGCPYKEFIDLKSGGEAK